MTDEFVRGGGALRLVLIEKLVAEGWAFLIEGDGVMGGLKLGEDFKEHEGEAVNGADDLAGFGDGERRGLAVLGGAEGVISPVDDGIAVKEDQERFFHALIITEWGRDEKFS